VLAARDLVIPLFDLAALMNHPVGGHTQLACWHPTGLFTAASGCIRVGIAAFRRLRVGNGATARRQVGTRPSVRATCTHCSLAALTPFVTIAERHRGASGVVDAARDQLRYSILDHSNNYGSPLSKAPP